MIKEVLAVDAISGAEVLVMVFKDGVMVLKGAMTRQGFAYRPEDVEWWPFEDFPEMLVWVEGFSDGPG
jgi:hypothetical protein